MKGFPHADGGTDGVHHDGVEPTPYDEFGSTGWCGDSDEMAGRNPIGARSRERVRVPNSSPPTVAKDSALVLGRADHDG